MFGKFNRILFGAVLIGGIMNCWGIEKNDSPSTTKNTEATHDSTCLSQISAISGSKKFLTLADEQKINSEIKQESQTLLRCKPSESDCLIGYNSLKMNLFNNDQYAIELCNELEKEFQDNGGDINEYTSALISLIDINCKNLIGSIKQLITYNEWESKNRFLAKLWMDIYIKFGGKTDEETEARINALFEYKK